MYERILVGTGGSETAARAVARAARAAGDPGAALKRGDDLLVVGTKGTTGAARFLLGSVPNKVSHHAPCALLIVPTS